MKQMLAVLVIWGLGLPAQSRAETKCTITRYDQSTPAAEQPTLFSGPVKDQDAFLFTKDGVKRDFKVTGKHHVDFLMKQHATPYVLISREVGGLVSIQVGHIQYWGPTFMTVAKEHFVTDAAVISHQTAPMALTVPAKHIGVSCVP